MDDKPKRRFGLFVAVFLAMIFLAFGGVVAFRVYQAREGARRVEEFAERLKQAEQEIYRRQLADTYGGKTPQETLRLYIEAVEKGDYELASKYFVLEKQERELKSLQNSPKGNIDNVIRLLKITIESPGSFSSKRDEYVISRPLTVDFVLYPSGVWKIVEI